jgi:small subunit ribosomal protein S8
MSWSDPIADMLTRIRNAQRAEFEAVEMPYSRLKGEITRLLKREGYVKDFVVEGGAQKVLRIYLKYTDDLAPAIQGLRRESRPGLRKYASSQDVPKVLGGLGIAVLSTSSGVMTDKEARDARVGGEVLCSVW